VRWPVGRVLRTSTVLRFSPCPTPLCMAQWHVSTAATNTTICRVPAVRAAVSDPVDDDATKCSATTVCAAAANATGSSSTTEHAAAAANATGSSSTTEHAAAASNTGPRANTASRSTTTCSSATPASAAAASTRSTTSECAKCGSGQCCSSTAPTTYVRTNPAAASVYTTTWSRTRLRARARTWAWF
jgi:hypothetical protein